MKNSCTENMWHNCITVTVKTIKGKITCQFMIWWRLMGCMVRPGWPLQECLQLCPQAVIRLLLGRTDLSALCGISPHQYLQAVTPSQGKYPTRFYWHQEIELHWSSRGKLKKNAGRLWVHFEEWMEILNKSLIKYSFPGKAFLIFSKLLNVIELFCHLALHFRSLLINCKWVRCRGKNY